jgi:hypothetical protein
MHLIWVDFTVLNVFLSKDGLNDAGQIAFLAQLADETKSIFVATPELSAEPTPIPESSYVLGLLAIGALGAGCVLKQKQRAKPAKSC